MTDSHFFEKLEEMGFDGTGYKYLSNDLIGGYVFICVLNGKWTEIDFERGEIFINRVFDNANEALKYIDKLLDSSKIKRFESIEEMF